ncbi:MAG: ParA family protein [Opitutales bacterium]
MARKISFLNFKGGVGKTSIVVNVAAILAKQGKRVLIVDCDPQSNSSIWLLKLDRWNDLQTERSDQTLLSVLRPNGVPAIHAIYEDAVLNAEGESALPGLDILPASFSLMDIEHEVEDDPSNPCYARFYEQVVSVEPQYDYIFFDCPPNMFKTTQCALYASDDIYAPANPDALSIIGFHLLVNKFLLFCMDSETHRNSMGASLAEIRGVILNGVKTGVNFAAPKQRLEIMIKRFASKRLVADDAGIFDAEVRHTVLAGRLVSQGLPAILSRDPDIITGVLDDYKHITELIVTGRTKLNEQKVSAES